jgi:hypothetical protein
MTTSTGTLDLRFMIETGPFINFKTSNNAQILHLYSVTWNRVLLKLCSHILVMMPGVGRLSMMVRSSIIVEARRWVARSAGRGRSAEGHGGVPLRTAVFHIFSWR